MDADILVIGGGIVGLSTAMQLLERRPGRSLILLEKEATLAAHQSGHNSGVVHAGVYYAPGSLKARFCREGSEATFAFARRHGVPIEQCGKLIVATSDLEVSRLGDLAERGRVNGLDLQWIDEVALGRLEPHIAGRAALLVPATGITDYSAIARTMARLVEAAGGQVLLNSRVRAMREDGDSVTVETDQRTFRARHAIVCGGLMADRLLRMCGLDADFCIVPFRGEYYRLPDSKNGIVKHLIYPVPDPALPFLGVHLTRMIGGYVTVGPNAVLALAREGYRWRDIDARDLADMATFGGFWRMIGQYARSGVREISNSIFRNGYLAQCRKYCPELALEDLLPYRGGVRAQAVKADGTMIHDFLIHRGRHSLHVCNAPSPAATSSLPIGRYLVDQFEAAFETAA